MPSGTGASAVTDRRAGRLAASITNLTDSALPPGAPPLRPAPALLDTGTENPDPADLQLAAYLLARERTGRPVQPRAKDLLLRANETKKEVLQLMPFGRANVASDQAITGNAGLHRVLALRHAITSYSSLGEHPSVTAARDAALSAFAGGGNCSEFANVAAHAHAGRLQEGERLQARASERLDHKWIELQGAESSDGLRAAAIIDAWGEGPVVEPVDNTFAAAGTQDGVDPPELNDHNVLEAFAEFWAPGDDMPTDAAGNIDSADAAAVHQQFQALRQDPGPAITRRFERLVEAHARKDTGPTGRVYLEPIPFVSTVLCQSAREAIEGQHDQPGLRRQAANFALEVVPSLTEQQAASAVDTILTYAENLRAAVARPLVAAAVAADAAAGEREEGATSP